jgi:hypothetical protein
MFQPFGHHQLCIAIHCWLHCSPLILPIVCSGYILCYWFDSLDVMLPHMFLLKCSVPKLFNCQHVTTRDKYSVIYNTK